MNKYFQKLLLLLFVVAFSVFSAGASFALSIDDVKKGYFENYPADKNYPNVGDAFSRFFSNPRWTITKAVKDKPAPFFSGVALLDGNKAILNIYFIIENGHVAIDNIYVHGERRFCRIVKLLPKMANIFGNNTMSDDSLLAAVYSK